MTALPSARAGATERMLRMSGTLNGEMTATTPAGTRRASESRGCSLGRISPVGRPGSAAASKHSCSAVCTENPAIAGIAPTSRMFHPVISAACS